MNSVVNIYLQNKEVINFVVVVLIYALVHFKAAVAFVKSKTTKAMFGVEKQAEQLVLNTGQDKMQAVEGMVFNKLPGWVRAVINLNRFRAIAQNFFDESKFFIEKNATVPAQPKAPTSKKQPESQQQDSKPFSATSEKQ